MDKQQKIAAAGKKRRTANGAEPGEGNANAPEGEPPQPDFEDEVAETAALVPGVGRNDHPAQGAQGAATAKAGAGGRTPEEELSTRLSEVAKHYKSQKDLPKEQRTPLHAPRQRASANRSPPAAAAAAAAATAAA